MVQVETSRQGSSSAEKDLERRFSKLNMSQQDALGEVKANRVLVWRLSQWVRGSDLALIKSHQEYYIQFGLPLKEIYGLT